jgi:hypothetical protein
MDAFSSLRKSTSEEPNTKLNLKFSSAPKILEKEGSTNENKKLGDGLKLRLRRLS